MQATGTAGTSAAGRYAAPPAGAFGVQLPGGAAPATALPAPATTRFLAEAGQAPTATPVALTGVTDTPIAVELVAPGIEELAGAKALAGRSSLPISVTEKTPSVDDVIKTLDDPVVNQSDLLVAKRDKLRAALIAGQLPGDPKQYVRMLDDLDFIIKMLQRAEEKKRLLKELMKKLMMGVLTPELISKAKSLGLVGFLKDAIRQMLKGGNISPQQAKAMATMLSIAGIQMPELDEFVLRHEKNLQQLTDARRAARGFQQQPTALQGGTLTTRPALQGVQALGMAPVSALT